jgi:hypothetical protein
MLMNMKTLKNPLVAVDVAVFSNIPLNRKVVIHDFDPETGRRAKASIARISEQTIRLQYTDWQEVKSVVLLDLEEGAAELVMPYLGEVGEVSAWVGIVIGKCHRYLRHDEIVD